MLGFASFGVASALVFLIVRTIYRLYFHPLRNVPGPKLAAASSAYEFYFNVIKGGKYIWEVERLHEIYGPIIRISPREVHINDVKFYEEIYAPGSRKRDKVREWVEGFDLNGGIVSSVSADLHRQRRVPLNKYFSKQAITNIEPMIQEKIDQLCDHLKSACKSQRVVDLDSGFAGLTSDIIHQYTIGYHSGNLDREDFNMDVRNAMNGLFQGIHILFFFPFLQPIANLIPLPTLKKILPYVAAFKEQRITIHNQIATIILGKEEKDDSMIGMLAQSRGLPDGFLEPARLTDEALTILTAGTETTARALTFGIFHIIQSQQVQEKLREELKTIMPTPQSQPTWDQLRQLPYLNAFIYESIRLSTGLASRTPRIAPDETLVYKNFVLPPGTIFSQWHYLLLMDPEMYPKPHVFDPERWIRGTTEDGERLDRYFIPFSKGPRMCIGFNLAYAELYLVIARLVSQFDFTLYDTSEKELAFARDFQAAFPEEGNISMRVKVSARG